MISVVIPAYNEANRLPRVLSEIESFHKSNPGVLSEVIVVDDGSKDATVERCSYYLFRIPLRIERLAKNSGKWSAVIHGVNVAKSDAVLILDADGSASIWELKKLNISELVEKRIAVFGTRFSKQSIVEGKSFFRTFISYGYKFFVRSVFKWVESYPCPVEDMQAPFKLIFKSRLQGSFFVASRFSGDLNFALLCTGPMVNFPLHFIHVRGGAIKGSTILDMVYETLVVGWRMKKYRKSLDRKVLLYMLRNHNIFK